MRLAIVSILTVLALPSFGEEPPDAERFTQTVSELGHDDYRVRERAHKQLRAAGTEARKALEDASENSTDAEVRERASILLHRMDAGPRIQQAIADLNATDWDKVKAAIYTLCDEFEEDTGAEEALSEASGGNDQSGKMASIIHQQWKNYQRQQQSYVRNSSIHRAQLLQQYYVNYRKNMKQSAEYMCKREFDKRAAKRKKLEKAQEKKVQKKR